MRIYTHERHTERDRAPTNIMWPSMTTDGIDTSDAWNYIRDRGLSAVLAEENGWYPSRTAMDNFLRIVIPAVSTVKDHVYWQARAISQNVHLRYQTPRGPRHGALILVKAFPDQEYESPTTTDKIVIVEGPMDALACADCGYDSIAIMGITPGETAIEHLAKLVDRRPSLIVLDNEPEAQSKAILLGARLASAGGTARVESLRNVKDLAAMKKQNRQIWIDRHMEEL